LNVAASESTHGDYFIYLHVATSQFRCCIDVFAENSREQMSCVRILFDEMLHETIAYVAVAFFFHVFSALDVACNISCMLRRFFFYARPSDASVRIGGASSSVFFF
jgi:hypothetical protein